MKKQMISILTCALLVGFTLTKKTYADVMTYTHATYDVTYFQSEARKMLAMDNEFRDSGTWYWNNDNTSKVENIHVPALEYNYSLEEVAMQRAAEALVILDHTRPNGEQYSTVKAKDGTTSFVEILAWSVGTTDVEEGFSYWLEEEEDYAGQIHRRNLLSEKYQSVGMSVAKYGNLTVYVQEFSLTKSDTKETKAFDGTMSAETDFATPNIADIQIEAPSAFDSYVVRVGDTLVVHDVVGYLTPKVTQSFYPNPKPVQFIPRFEASDQESKTRINILGNSISGKKEGKASITVSSGNPTFDKDKRFMTVEVVAGDKITMYRLYNKNSGEHFYTMSTDERDHLIEVGWNDEGVAWYAPKMSNTPVYRLYNENGGEHHYTVSLDEKEDLEEEGWKYEGVGWFSSDSEDEPLYRLYNPNAYANNHHYTTSPQETADLIALGWKDEGIAWFGIKG